MHQVLRRNQLLLLLLLLLLLFLLLLSLLSSLLLLLFAIFGSKFCPLLIGNNISVGVPSRSIRNFTHFSMAGKNCSSARYATSANLVHSNIDTFSSPIISLKQILSWW